MFLICDGGKTETILRVLKGKEYFVNETAEIVRISVEIERTFKLNLKNMCSI